MPKRKIVSDDSDFEGSAGEDDGEWEDRPDAAEDDNAQEDDDEEEVWNNRRQKKPISPVRTRATKSAKPQGPSRLRAVPVEQYKAQWIKKGSAQSAEVPSQLRLIDYLGTNRKTGTLLERFGYGRAKSSTTATSKKKSFSSRSNRPEPEDDAFIDDGSEIEKEEEEESFLLDDDEEEAEEELVFSDDDSAPKRRSTRRLTKKRDMAPPRRRRDGSEDDEYDDDDDVEVVSTSTTTRLDLVDDENENDEEENEENDDEDLKRALRKSRMEMLRDRSRRRNKERETRQVMRLSAREAEKQKARAERLEIGSDDDDEGEQDEEDEDSDEDVAAVNNLLSKCEKTASTLHSLLKQMHAAQTKGEEGQTTSGITVLKQPRTIQRTLKSYQVAGLNWLYLLHSQNLNGILADEMGLGKTVQTISLLAQLQLDGNQGPHIIIVPASTLHNWKKELASWCPDLRVCVYYGSLAEREEIRAEIKSVPADYYNVWVTTYTVAVSKHDKPFLQKRRFQYMVLDEAQNIKNTSSARYKSLFALKTKHRLLLTGTPVENTLNELMALLYFLLPQLFGSPRDYEELKLHLARAQKRSDLLESGFISRMKQIVTPFLLRRLKSEVSIELDPKKERIVRCPMPEIQAQLYDDLLSRSKKHIAESSAAKTEIEGASLAMVEEVLDDEEPRLAADAKNKKKKPVPPSPKKLSNNTFLNMCMELIKMADHPLLLRSHYNDQKVRELAVLLKKHYPTEFNGPLCEVEEDLRLNSDFTIHQVVASRQKIPASYHLNLDCVWEASAKMEHLRTLLPDLFAQDRRVLIFSLMTRMLDILEVFLEKLGYRFLRLDGTTPVAERQEMIDEFNTDLSIPVFLLSTKAGGLGINLTSADTVIFYDSSFNPQVDRQAEDRVHRLGQLKQVEIIRLVSKNTIDEHILKMATQKKKLSEALLAEGSYAAKSGSYGGPSAMDVKDILKVITASVHAPSPLAKREPTASSSLANGGDGSRGSSSSTARAKPKPPRLFDAVDDEAVVDETERETAPVDAADMSATSTTTTTTATGIATDGHANGSASHAVAARKRKRIEEEEEEEEKEEDKRPVISLGSDEEGEDDDVVVIKKRQKMSETTSKSNGNGSTVVKKETTAIDEGSTKKKKKEKATNGADHKGNAAPPSSADVKGKPKQLTLEEFKRKYSSKPK